MSREEKKSRKSFMNSFKKYVRKRSYHMSGIICTIHKGGVIICDNYRVITLQCTTYKILENILYAQLVPYAEVIMGKHRGGFSKRKLNC